MTKFIPCILASCLLAACAAPSVTVTDRDSSAAAAWKLQREQDGQRDRQRDLWLKYEEDWRVKVEQVGSRLYDAQPEGKPTGELRLAVALAADGSVRSTTINRSSGNEVLDNLALKTVSEASPFAAFPAELGAGYDQAVITRNWVFGPNLNVGTK